MQMGAARPIRVLAVDDSVVMRGVLRTLFLAPQLPSAELPEMVLCGVAADGLECLESVLRLRPDVVILDLEMPRMNGLDVLERLRMEEPGLPVIMCSAYTERGARATLDALAMGAADYVMKPSEQSDFATAKMTLANQLLPKIAALAGVGFEALSQVRGRTTRQEIAGSSAPQNPERTPSSMPAAASTQVNIVTIGVSTGGPSALEAVLPHLAGGFPVPIAIVQHMPKLFTGELAERLDRCCALRVREARHGEELVPGTVWLAPGDSHMEVAEAAAGPAFGNGNDGVRKVAIHLHQQRSLNHCKPSVDYLFSSAARVYGAGTLALVMTGMGSDGLTGARRVHEAGGVVLAQDAATSAVWGMPGRVFEAGLARTPLPLQQIAAELTRRARVGRSGHAAHDAAAIMPVPQRNRNTTAKPHPEVLHGLL